MLMFSAGWRVTSQQKTVMWLGSGQRSLVGHPNTLALAQGGLVYASRCVAAQEFFQGGVGAATGDTPVGLGQDSAVDVVAGNSQTSIRFVILDDVN